MKTKNTAKTTSGTKADPTKDFQICHIGFLDAVICTNLPIEEAQARLRIESPVGTRSNWTFDGKPENQVPCPDGQGKTHYRLFC